MAEALPESIDCCAGALLGAEGVDAVVVATAAAEVAVLMGRGTTRK